MKRYCLALLSALLTSACAQAPNVDRSGDANDIARHQPEGVSGMTVQPGWRGEKFAVGAANPLASSAGLEILRAGGSAIDAAIAVQMVLTLVEPQSSGIGGGAFLLYYDGHNVLAFDGRETAPATVSETLFIKADGQPMTFAEAVFGGRAVGVPGALRMLEMAHAAYGKLPWSQLFAPAITLAEKGFPVSPRLFKLLKADPHLRKDPRASAYFYERNGEPHAIGTLLRNTDLAYVLRRIAAEGSRALYEGEIAQAVVDQVRKHPSNPGHLSMADMSAYRAKRRDPLCTIYAPETKRENHSYRICGFPPPSSGAIVIAQILGILDHSEARRLDFEDPLWMHYYTEASRLAFADRAKYIADPDFVVAPEGRWSSLIAPSYLAERVRLIGPRSMKAAVPGSPSPQHVNYSSMPEQVEYGTSHISVVDASGNALAMTSSIEDAFGARLMVRGFLLNNELTDFSFTPADSSGTPVANRVEPGKRPRSSMSPTLVFDNDNGEFVLSGGSPGGAMIIHYTAKLLYATLNWGLTPQQAIDLPNFGSLNGPTLLEAKRFPLAFTQALQSRGHEVKELDLNSGLQAIQKSQGSYVGGADPRREGRVMGE
ncbi:gamma-glutamyltransferase family protein [Propionivibrio sp.]|uniref:gamma-glutamyltransferase family protein n=1 Tax=Propionivibrio sp. TaxID=2212460 RepID=UPI0025D12917|nr:gamma-glutamyltransferase family protein [Propionivibrio sp.]MBK7357023.1 gamma-glutamyltransferase family protein [Propionivibrio sp.]MBK8401547.1 gamma-glutamyltransferase family protein [Propionivibrio sp.]MBK8745054.1 gamma-glutamyltransferase family protein [Propionivibrio sp.]MBK8894043.1 gamma-glutamyltransferase family protein [Propionivibrio sp.]MBL0209065.1 gamma-glutamyltransferase family protein [Propionivibrio sp.]